MMGCSRLVLLATATLAMVSATTSAQTVPRPAPTVAQQRAYTLSLTCWAVAAHYRNEADAVRTADAMRRTGAVLGYDNARISHDATTMASALGAQMHNDPNLMERHRASCRRIGLAS